MFLANLRRMVWTRTLSWGWRWDGSYHLPSHRRRSWLSNE